MGVDVVGFESCETNGRPGFCGVTPDGRSTECFTYDPESLGQRQGAIAKVRKAYHELLATEQAVEPAERSTAGTVPVTPPV